MEFFALELGSSLIKGSLEDIENTAKAFMKKMEKIRC